MEKAAQPVTKDKLDRILNSLTYIERTVFQLRTGLGDGYSYQNLQVAHVFRSTPQKIAAIFRRARTKVLESLADELPESTIEVSVKSSVLEATKTLTPHLIAHLKSVPDDLRLLDGTVFENLIAEFFAAKGFDDVRLVGRLSTTAADIYAMKRIQPDATEVRMFIETKRWKDRVGVEVVDRVYGAIVSEKETFGWHMAMIVSLAGFTNMRKYPGDRLRMLGIDLKDGNDVRDWLANYRFQKVGLWLPNAKNP